MSLLVVAPELVESAAANVESIGSALRAANAAAAVPTTGIAAAGADEVSAAVAALFAGHGQEFQALSAQASAFHQQFVQALSSGAGSYLTAEAANASPLQAAEQNMLRVINAPTELLLGRPLISTGSSGPSGGAATSNATGTVITSTSATVPLTVFGGTEPLVNASVGNGPTVPLLVDTGSTGLVIPIKDAGDC